MSRTFRVEKWGRKRHENTPTRTDTHARSLNHSDGKCKQATIVACLWACRWWGREWETEMMFTFAHSSPFWPPISDHFWSLFNEAELFFLPMIVLPFKSPPKPSTRQLMRRNILVNYSCVADRNARAKRAIKRNESYGFCDRNEFLISPFPVIWQLLSSSAMAKVVTCGTVTLPIKEALKAHRGLIYSAN